MTHLVETQSLTFVTPQKASQEIIVVLGSITEAGEIFAKDNNNIRALLSSFTNELQLVQASSTGLIIAGHDNLLLLHRQWQRLKRGILPFKDGSVETIIVLHKQAVSSDQRYGISTWKVAAYEVDDNAVVVSLRRDLVHR